MDWHKFEIVTGEDESDKLGVTLEWDDPEMRLIRLKNVIKRILGEWTNAHHSVYVISLNPRVIWNTQFRNANQNYIEGKPCFYVGSTGHPVEIRYNQHKTGYLANRYAQNHGEGLAYEFFEGLNPMPWEEAKKVEVTLAERLRAHGYGVWQN